MISRVRNLVTAQMLPKNLRISAILVAIYQVVSWFCFLLVCRIIINALFCCQIPANCTLFDVRDAFGFGACGGDDKHLVS